ncbi:MAG: T9SS type A sorting domain-containing protein [Bacteroidia bacterium]
MRKPRLFPLLLATAMYLAIFGGKALAQPDTWVTSFGTNLTDTPEDLLVDAAGNTYVSGYFRDTLRIGNVELASAGLTDVFLAKFDPNGQLAWAKRYGWYSNEFAHGLAFDNWGNVIMVGEYQDSSIFEGDTLWSGDTLYYGAPAETYDVFWVRVTPSGVMEKVWADGWFGSEAFYEVSVSPNDLLYFSGMYRTFNNWTFASIYDVRGWGRGYDDAIWVRSDTAGVMDHKAIAEGRYVDRGHALDLIGDSLVVMGGTFQDTCYFIDSVDYRVTGFEDDVFVAAYGDTGAIRWVVVGGSHGVDHLNALITDAQGNSYFAGAFDSVFTMDGQTVTGSGMLDGYVGKIDMSGNLLWLRKFGGAGFDMVRDLRLMASGDLLVTGYFQRTMDLGSGVTVTLADTTDQDAYVAKIDNNGNAIWLKNLGGDNPDVGVAVAEDAAGYIYAVGTFTGVGTFGQLSDTAEGGEDVYLLRMNADGAVSAPGGNEWQPTAVAWPNPTRDMFSIRYELPVAADVQISLLDLQGRVLRNIDQGRQASGSGSATVDCQELAAGMYLYRLTAGKASVTGRIAVAR